MTEKIELWQKTSKKTVLDNEIEAFTFDDIPAVVIEERHWWKGKDEPIGEKVSTGINHAVFSNMQQASVTLTKEEAIALAKAILKHCGEEDAD